MSNRDISVGFRRVRRDRLIQDQDHDAYKMRGKLPEPTVCPQCHAVYRKGRWTWGVEPKGAHQETCPACHRVNDHFPAGFVSLAGEYFMSHRGEIMYLVQHEEAREKEAHPLKRIIAIEDEGDAVLVTTTDIHLARDIGDAIQSAYKGELEFHYNSEENLLRVNWVH